MSEETKHPYPQSVIIAKRKRQAKLRYILNMRESGMKLREIGEYLGVSKENVRQKVAMAQRLKKQIYRTGDVYQEFKEHYDNVMGLAPPLRKRYDLSNSNINRIRNMLIKVYTTSEDLHIFEHVTDVSILRDIPDGFDVGWETYQFEDSPVNEGDVFTPLLRWAQDGPKQTFVYNKAFICNDDGKTLEKVVSGPQVV